ncbi:MAG: YHS domain-containing protein [Anaerolineae bacterium]|jgi:YHS domain-containing protein
MEYVITTEQPFEQIESRIVAALEQHGFAVQRTFSLRSATGSVSANENPEYSVFMIYGSHARQQPVGLITLYQRGGRTVIRPVLTPSADADMDAELVAVLVLSGLEFCVDVVGSEACIDSDHAAKGGSALLQDPVCGNWFRRHQAEAAVEYEGELYYVCCRLCREEFERDPAHYAWPEERGRGGTK